MRVLIVDDEADIREIIRDELSFGNHEVVEASGGNPALEIIKAGGVDAVISDISMPDGNGIDLLKGARALSADKPAIVLISGFSDVTQINAFDVGVDCMLGKPFNLKEISDALARVTAPRDRRWAASPPDRASAPLISREISGSIDAKGLPAFGLGRGGFRVSATETRLAPGAPVRFEIKFSGGPVSELAGTGWIRWSRHDVEPAFGIEIESLSASCLTAVYELIRQPSIGTPFIPKGVSV